MKIAVAASGLGHVARGVESWAADLGNALAAREADVRLCKAVGPPRASHERVIRCWTRNSAAADRINRLVPRPLAWRLGIESTYGIEQASFAVGLLRLLRREGVDILHVQDPHLALIAQRAARVGLIQARTILAHGTEESLAFQSKIRFLQHLAPWHLEQATTQGVHGESWTAIPNFVDPGLFHPGKAADLRTELNISPTSMVVLAVAAIKRDHKRMDYLIDEFARLLAARPDRAATLVIAGGRERQTAGLIADGTARLGDRVRFLPQYPRSRIPDLYRVADLFTLTSLKEMMPIALLEALASGLPCLVHDHPVMTWMIGSGGRTVDMTTPGALAAALGAGLDDPTWRAEAGEQARHRASDVFGRDRVVGQILDYYATVLESRRRRGPR